MKLRKAKSCNGCRASEGVGCAARWCALGYKVQTVRRTVGGFDLHEGQPSEPCPKPRTIGQYMDLRAIAYKTNGKPL